MTNIDDEREALAKLLHRIADDQNNSWFDDADGVLAAGFRRTAVQEPGEREAKIHGELVTMRVKEWRRITDELARLRTMEGQLEEPEPGKRLDPDFRADLVDAASHRITDAWADVPEGLDAETLAQNVVAAQEFLWIARGFPVAVQEPQGEPSDAPTVQLVARRGGKTRALIDSMLAQANERGIHVEVVYPQDGPTDVALLAAANAYMHYKPPYDDLSAFSIEFLDDMRTALTAAYETKGEGR